MVRGRKGKIVKSKVRRAFRSALRMGKRRLAKAYAQVSGKLVATTITKRKGGKRRRRRRSRRMRYR